MEPTDHVHCIYTSGAVRPFTPMELTQLLEGARANNALLGVTGMLLYESAAFFQVLEGLAEVVVPLYERIARDPRHRRVTKLIVEPIEAPMFESWTMGHPRVTRRDLQQIEGLNDFFASGKAYCEMEPGRARTLVTAFREGRWRRTLAA